MSIRSFGPHELDYCGLIEELSCAPNFPTSAHLRNHLIAAYAALPPSDHVDLSKQDQWKTYQEYRRGVQLLAFGDVPSSALKDGNISTAGQGLWAVATIFPIYAPSWLKQSTELNQDSGMWHTMRLSLWLSSESNARTGPLSIDDVHVANKIEGEMLSYIFHDFVPTAAQKLTEVHQGEGSTHGKEQYTVDLFAINEAWIKVLRRWSEELDPTIKLTRANPCMTFVKEEKSALVGIDIPPRWHVSSIQSDDQVLLAQSSNSLPFPLWYVKNRKHISVLVYDGQGEVSRQEYPKEIQSGSPVAWAYAHDDLSLASLHVAEPYRRLGLGKYCVDLMAKKLIKAQKQALHVAGCTSSDTSTPYLLDTEMHKGASRLFFEQQGFSGIQINTWGSIIITTNPILSQRR